MGHSRAKHGNCLVHLLIHLPYMFPSLKFMTQYSNDSKYKKSGGDLFTGKSLVVLSKNEHIQSNQAS